MMKKPDDGVGCVDARGVAAARPGDERRILVIEDDVLSALALTRSLTEAGFVVVGPAHTVDDGLSLAADVAVAGAVIDVDLGDPDGRSGEDVADRLGLLDIPVVFVTGLRRASIAAHLRTHAFMSKPYDLRALVRLLAGALPAAPAA